MIVVWLLFAIGAIATGACFARGLRGAGLVGSLAGLGVAAVLLVPALADIRLVSMGAALLYAVGMVAVLVTAHPVEAAGLEAQARSHQTRRAVIGGIVGVVPGGLLIVVPILLHEWGVISADASQIGFFGIFLVPVGLLAGALAGYLSGAPSTPKEHEVGPRS